jgi:hypothetical protein
LFLGADGRLGAGHGRKCIANLLLVDWGQM